MNQPFLQDLKFGLRQVRRSPFVAMLAICCLAAGIGLSTFMFSITYAVVGRGLPFDDQERIIHVMRQESYEVSEGRTLIHLDDYRLIKEQQTTLSDLSAITMDGVTVGRPGLPNRVSGAYVTSSFFDVLPVKPIMGRSFVESDFEPSANNVLILSHDTWEKYFASDPDVVGMACVCEGKPFTVIGVLPEGYDYPFNQEVWMPLILETIKEQTGWIDFVTLIGRLDEGRTLAEAQAEYDALIHRIEEFESQPELGHTIPSLKPFFNRFVGNEIRVLMWSMFGATFLVLLIACSNVSSLVTARMVVRSNELAIRSALGANRKRIIAQIMGETFLYGLFGAILGLAIAWKALGFLWQFLSQHRFSPPAFMEFRLDPVSVFVAFCLLMLSVLIAGILPALRSSRPNILSLLNDGQRTGSSKRLSRLSSLSTIMQIAFSFALLVAAGRLIAAIVIMGAMDYPFEKRGLLVGSLAIDHQSYSEKEEAVRFWDELHRNLQTIPGADSVSLGFNMPCVFAMTDPIRIDGEDYASPEDYPHVRVDVISPGYFKTLGVELLDGRDFNDGDVRGKESVAIINTVMAEKFWPRENPIGKIFHMEGKGEYTDVKERVHRVIGVVPDLKMAGLINPNDDGAGFYRPQGQGLWGDQKIFLRTSGNPESFIPEVQRVISLLDPNIAFTEAMSFENHVHDAFFYFRFFLNLFSTFGGLALLLASAGIYGIIQYSVSQRTVEIGIRMCLGAPPASIWRMVFWRGLRNTLIGIVIGAVISVALIQVLMVTFQGMETEYYSYAAAFLVLLLVSVLANGVPARRAARLDPMNALRVQ